MVTKNVNIFYCNFIDSCILYQQNLYQHLNQQLYFISTEVLLYKTTENCDAFLMMQQQNIDPNTLHL